MKDVRLGSLSSGLFWHYSILLLCSIASAFSFSTVEGPLAEYNESSVGWITSSQIFFMNGTVFIVGSTTQSPEHADFPLVRKTLR